MGTGHSSPRRCLCFPGGARGGRRREPPRRTRRHRRARRLHGVRVRGRVRGARSAARAGRRRGAHPGCASAAEAEASARAAAAGHGATVGLPRTCRRSPGATPRAPSASSPPRDLLRRGKPRAATPSTNSTRRRVPCHETSVSRSSPWRRSSRSSPPSCSVPAAEASSPRPSGRRASRPDPLPARRRVRRVSPSPGPPPAVLGRQRFACETGVRSAARDRSPSRAAIPSGSRSSRTRPIGFTSTATTGTSSSSRGERCA